MASTYDGTGVQYYAVKDFTFQNGVTLPAVRVAYREFNPTSQKAALIPTCFHGRINKTLNFTEGSLRDHRVIVVATLGNGESAAPSNTPNFPATIDYRDSVRLQHKLVTEHLKIASLDVVLGFSMGGQTTYHWAAMFPDMVHSAVIICSAARTSLHNYQFLEGPKAAIQNSIDYNDDSFRVHKIPPVRGLHAFGRAYSAWLTSAEWFEDRLFEKGGFKTLNDWADAIAQGYEDWHPDDLLAMLGMWQRSDLGLVAGTNSQSVPLDQALRTLTARILLMPGRTDQYFRWEANEKEAAHLKNGRVEVIPSSWGHLAGGGANQEDNEWMDHKISEFLSQA